MRGIRLTTLGRTELTRPDGTDIISVLAQPSRFALLVYLSIEAADRFVRRDTVATLLWPTRDQSSARANLRKSLYFLRQSLGPDVLITRGDEEIGIDRSLLSCDVVALLSGEDVPVEGPFLDGFHFSGATAEWEDWRSSVEQRVRAHVPQGKTGGPQALTSPPESNAVDVVASPEPRKRLALLTPLMIALTVAAVLWGLTHRDSGPPTRYDTVRLGSGAQFPTGVQRHYALSPEGAGILFRDSVGAKQGTWWKAVDAPASTYMAGLDDIFGPVFSPDGRWLAFSRNGQLWKQEFGREPSVLLVDSISYDFNPGIAWLPGGGILYEGREHDLRLLNEKNGTTEILATADQVGQVFHVRALRTGRGVVVTGCDGWCEAATPRLSYVDLTRDTVIPLRSNVWMAWPMSDNGLVMVDDQGAVFAARFDPSNGTLGASIPLLSGVRVSPFPDIAMGDDGSLLYVPGEVDRFRERLVWVDRTGASEPLDSNWPGTMRVRAMSLSPDGQRLALEMLNAASGAQIWIKELSGGPFAPLTTRPDGHRRPVWSADGGAIAFITQALTADSSWTGYVSTLPSDASEAVPEPLLRHDQMIMEVVMTASWNTVVVRLGDAALSEGDIAIAHLGTSKKWESFQNLRANEYGLGLSPDDRWLAYVSEASGRPEVYVRPFPGPGPRVQVSTDGGVEPRWAHSGREIFFRSLRPDNPDGHTAFMVAASVTTAPGFRVDSVRTLFGTAGYIRGPRIPLYEVSPDDQRFLMVTEFGPRAWSRGDPVVYSGQWYWTADIQAKLRR